MAEDVISGYPFQLLARCDFSYDADGNLTQIKNYNSNSVKFKFEYNEGQLYGLTDFDGNGYLFGRAHWIKSESYADVDYKLYLREQSGL